MDILYYSNYCKHSKEVLGFLVKNDLVKSLNCICVDKRKVNPQNGQIQITLENGTSVLMPPNVHSVPALMLLKDNYRVVMGNSIVEYFKPHVSESNDMATQGNGEPMSFSLGSKHVMSETFTSYSATTEELSAKGSGGSRDLHHYVPATGYTPTIQTPPDTYKPDKISQDVTVDSIQQQRNTDVVQNTQMPFLPQTI
jgi:uncharacterized Fe-S cluster protein YjdI